MLKVSTNSVSKGGHSMNKDTMARHIERVAVIKNLKDGKIKQSIAALQLSLSVRQIRRIHKKYSQGGAIALFHQNMGKQSPRKISSEVEDRALGWIKANGSDFGPTFAQEKLEEYINIKVSFGTVRNWLIKSGLLKPRSKPKKNLFERRKRKAFAGLMLQVDGSPHNWFEDRGERCALLTVIDDATGKIMARFAKQETISDLMILLKNYIELYGSPHMVYTDNVAPYKVNINNQEGDKKTQLGRALEELNIELVHANSPQAKGRIERNHATHQDRLIKELRLRNIATIEAANEYLEKEYLAQFNQKFSIKPAREQNAHRPKKNYNLDLIFSLQEERIMQNDGIIQYKNMLFQITKNRIYVKPKGKIIIREHLDGSLSFWLDQIQLGYEQIDERPTIENEAIQKAFQPRKASEANKRWNSGIYTRTSPLMMYSKKKGE